ncbi:MAG: hypothetical protein WKG32_11530 [Gemmatimonadaceae bacterium]
MPTRREMLRRGALAATLIAGAPRAALASRRRAGVSAFMQGAAGIGTLLLRLDAAERGARPAPTLPDSPF